MEERLLCKQDVVGSIPSGSTIRRSGLRRAHSSVGQSTRLISAGSVVQVHLGPPSAGEETAKLSFFDSPG
jgi:hypothetical protein